MKRRQFIIGTGSAAIGGSALLGSGAFSRVESQRSVTVEVAQDPDAYLGMDKCSIDGVETPNSSYAWLDDNGHLEILMNPDNPTVGESALGEGINSDSLMWADYVFQLCNNGKEDVCIYIEDDDNWPRAPEEYDEERRIDFYLGENRDSSIVGEENSVLLPLGECVCLGLKTNSKGLSEGDEILEELDNEIRIVADVDGDCVEQEALCPDLEGDYQCTTYEEENGSWVRTGSRFFITNLGTAPGSFDLAVADAPSDFRSDLPIGTDAMRSIVTDASVPQQAVVTWDTPEGCEPAQTWGEYKAAEGIDDLDDWYDTYGTGSGASAAPEDFDDDAAVAVLNVPEQDVAPGDTVGPDGTIDDEDYPDMSQEAEDAGWITCEKEGLSNS